MVITRGRSIQAKDALSRPLAGVSKEHKNVSTSTIPRENVSNREIIIADPDLPNITVLDRNRTEKLNFQMDFRTTRTNGELSFTADREAIPFSLGTMPWKFIIKKKEGRNLSIAIHLQPWITANQWKISISPSIRLSRTDAAGRVWKSDDMELESGIFNCEVLGLRWRGLPDARWSNMMPALEEGQQTVLTVVDVEVVVTIKEMFGFRCRRRFSYDFTQPNRDSDLVFKFEDGDVYINANLLSFHSPYFAATKDRLAAMKRDENGFPFEEMDGKREEFIELMQMVYPSSHKVTDENVAFILPLADRFLFDGVLKECEKFLMGHFSGQKTDIVLKLHWSSLYSMMDLQNWCMAQFRTRQAISKVEESEYFRQLPANILSLLFQKLLRITS